MEREGGGEWAQSEISRGELEEMVSFRGVKGERDRTPPARPFDSAQGERPRPAPGMDSGSEAGMTGKRGIGRFANRPYRGDDGSTGASNR